MKHVTQPNEPANPTVDTHFDSSSGAPSVYTFNNGMTKREIIATHLYSAILAGHKQEDLLLPGCENLAYNAIRCADALINELNRTAQ